MPASVFSFIIWIILSALLSGFACANTIDPTEKIKALQQFAQKKQLGQHPEWLKLLHYKPLGNQWLSQVDDTLFFNHPNGPRDPTLELDSTLAAFYAQQTDDDMHPQCRFPARLIWLQNQLENGLTDLPSVRCPLYKTWRASVPDQAIALIFPAYHLNSPSSMFGHTLLRLDPAKVNTGSDWLSMAVNFGADIKADDNSIFYAFKGLSGGYPGFFITTPYFKKIREYNQDENRDIWEYRLNLRPDEIQRMVTHLWELKTIKFDYYFFDENCSYRLLELLEVARPGIELTQQFGLTAIPVDTVRAIKNAGLIESNAYRPSQVTELEHLLQNIPAERHALIKEIAFQPERITSPEVQAIDKVLQKKLIDAAYRLLRYEQGTNDRDELIAKNRYRLLEQLNSYPIQENSRPEKQDPPENGHFSRRASFALGQQTKHNYLDFSYRMSYHSLEDNPEGFLQGAQINLGNLQVRAYENGPLQIEQLDLVDIFSLSPRSALFSPLSWRVYAGLERQPTRARDVLVAHLTGGGGVAYAPLQNNLSYFLVGLRLEKNGEFADFLQPALNITWGSLHHFSSNTGHLQLIGEQFTNQETRLKARYTHKFFLSQNQAINLQVTHQHNENQHQQDVHLAYQHYF